MDLRISDAFADNRAMTEPQQFLTYQSEDSELIENSVVRLFANNFRSVVKRLPWEKPQ